MSDGPVTAARLRDLTPAQAAALWLVKLQGDGVIGEAALFQSWLDESEDNRIAFERAEGLWALFDDPASDALSELRKDALAVTAEPQRARWRPYAFAALAAALLVAFLGVLNLMPLRPEATQLAAAPSQYVTGVGQRSTVTLPDGTRVTLDENSRLRLAFAEGRRRVVLERGRSYFDVAHDRAHPFSVLAGERTITALGTRFDVQLKVNTLRVALEEGRVSVGRGNKGVILVPGEQLVSQAGKEDTVSRFEPAAVDAWRSEFIEFHDTTLADAVAEMNRSSATQLVVDPTVARLRVSGRFRRGDPERFGRGLARILPVKIVRTAPGRLAVRPR